jgi:predicted ATPase
VTFGSDPGVIGLVNLAWLEWFAGRPDAAISFSERAIALSRELTYKLGMAYALGMSAALYQCMGEPAQTARLAEETIDIARRHDFPYWSAWQSVLLGWCRAQDGDFPQAIELMERGLESYRGTGAELFGCHMLALLAEVCLQAGQPGRALELCDQALASGTRTDAHFYDAEIHRIEGHCILVRDGDSAGALGCFDEALSIAGQQGARMLQLRSSISAAEAMAAGGHREEARALASEALHALEGTRALAETRRASRVLENL